VDDDLDSVYELAYEEAKRALSNQASALDALRARAGTLLAVAALATSFLGGLVFQNDTPEGWAPQFGIFAFIAVVVLLLLVVLPLPGWRFTLSARAVIRDFVEADSPASLAQTHRELALRFDQWLDRNERRPSRTLSPPDPIRLGPNGDRGASLPSVRSGSRRAT
jgi:hypothetical protein